MSSLFLTLVAEQMRMQRYAKRTIESYIYWIKAYVKRRRADFCKEKALFRLLAF